MEQLDVEHAAIASVGTTAALLTAHEQRSDAKLSLVDRVKAAASSYKPSLLALLALMPIIDFTSDLGSFNSLMNTAHLVAASVVMLILFFNWLAPTHCFEWNIFVDIRMKPW